MRAYYSGPVSTETTVPGGPQTPSPPPPTPPRRRLAVNTAIVAVATAGSRIAGLAREIAQAAYFATSAAASAFTLASQVPNLFSNLFSQAALLLGSQCRKPASSWGSVMWPPP